MFAIRPLRLRLIHVLIGLVLISIVGTSTIQNIAGILTQKKTLTDSTLHTNYEQALKLSETMNTLLGSMQSSLESAAQAFSAHKLASIQEPLDLLLNSSQLFNSVFLVNASGVITGISPASVGLTGSNMDGELCEIPLTLKRPYITSPYIGLSGRMVVLFTHPIFDEHGAYLGFVGGSIYLREDNVFTRIFGNQPRSQNGTYHYVVDSEGHLIYHPTIERIGVDVSANAVVSQVLTGASGYSKVTNTQDIPFLAGYASVGRNSWGIIVQTPQTVIDESGSTMIRNQIKYATPFVLLLLLFTLIVARRLSMPFTALTDTARRIASGERVAKLPSPSVWNYEAFHLNRAVTLAVRGLQKKADHYSVEAHTDALTGLMNRRTFESTTQVWVSGSVPFAIIVLDIDHFKSINDRYGHQIGDEVLKFAAELLQAETRRDEICCRYGGEEFVILLPHTKAEHAYEVAERIRKHLERTPSPVGAPITISIGISRFPNRELGFEEAFYLADQALYAAKNSGRNRTVISDEIRAASDFD
ncbi:diguanylate cyclase (GGDEF)-like protein [Paenibacillus phyllosphaerae]|uniref:Diguanylate cyclase (GGDEF)-like protein n=1 Tax=Paenibacillus phyllosphaerae TaxID=274593 RepID=A0A7W5B4F8_9BACL|nr:sensor domain-containing diguanylate cyclase [Paenibacillus phyllosphaerae]MBB3114230.1 diguanylate cyclase (GGDEF)-like protein [Paenibacillus phyllosphaerae]